MRALRTYNSDYKNPISVIQVCIFTWSIKLITGLKTTFTMELIKSYLRQIFIIVNFRKILMYMQGIFKHSSSGMVKRLAIAILYIMLYSTNVFSKHCMYIHCREKLVNKSTKCHSDTKW